MLFYIYYFYFNLCLFWWSILMQHGQRKSSSIKNCICWVIEIVKKQQYLSWLAFGQVSFYLPPLIWYSLSEIVFWQDFLWIIESHHCFFFNYCFRWLKNYSYYKVILKLEQSGANIITVGWCRPGPLMPCSLVTGRSDARSWKILLIRFTGEAPWEKPSPGPFRPRKKLWCLCLL